VATLPTDRPAQNPDVEWAVEDIKRLLPIRQKALDYYEGRHPLNFASTKFRNTFGQLFQELRDNLCDDVVDEPVNRLQIIGWSGTNAQAAQEWWESQRGDARAGAIHQHAFRGADGFAMVWDVEDDGVPRLYVQDPRQWAIRYSASEPDRPEVAAKCWREGKGYRLNLYYPANERRGTRGRIEHYYSRGYDTTSGEKGIPSAKAFRPFVQQEVVDASGNLLVPPVDWYEEHDRDFPVFHFPNGELGGYGQSALRDVFPLQDAQNKLLCDFLVSSESIALPKRFASGIQVATDPVTGQEDNPFTEEKNLWWTKAKEAAMTQFPGVEVDGHLKAMDALTLKIARKGGLPPHAVNLWSAGAGDAPSGLSLLLSEGKMVKLCRDRQRDWGVVWRNLVAYALAFGSGTSDSTTVDPEWAPPETRDEKGLWETIVLKKAAVGSVVPDAQFAREGGYDDKELEEFQSEKEDETARKMDAAQTAMGGRISPAGPLPPGGFPSGPVPPNGAAQPTPAGGR
jgi:hypothetical protein